MKQDLLHALEQIGASARILLEETNLTVRQEKFILSISAAARDLYDLIISIPELTGANAHAVFSFEWRSYLASIIGYVELLMDDEEDQLYDSQPEHVYIIDMESKRLLDYLSQLEM